MPKHSCSSHSQGVPSYVRGNRANVIRRELEEVLLNIIFKEKLEWHIWSCKGRTKNFDNIVEACVVSKKV